MNTSLPVRTFTVFCQETSGNGTIHIDSVEATDLESAILAGREQYQSDWNSGPRGEKAPFPLEDIHGLGVVAGDCHHPPLGGPSRMMLIRLSQQPITPNLKTSSNNHENHHQKQRPPHRNPAACTASVRHRRHPASPPSVASTNANKTTDAKIHGLPVIVGVNAYIKPEH